MIFNIFCIHGSNKVYVIGFIVCLLICTGPAILFATAQTDPPQIRIMSYNIHYGVGMDGIYNLGNIAKVITKAAPDIVGLQEIRDSLMAEELGKLTGMKVVFGHSLGNADGYGDAILSKHPFEWVANYAIPSASSSRYQAMAVDVDLSSILPSFGKLRLINTHFDWLRTIGSEHARLASVDVIEEAFFKETASFSAILTADLNSLPSSPVLKKFEHYGWRNHADSVMHYTHSATAPTAQIDYVLFKPHHKFHVKKLFVMYGEESSDHLPIVMDLLLKE